MPSKIQMERPTLEELFNMLVKALEGCLRLDPYCDHTYTHREGAIWEVCDYCKKQWADDEGGIQSDPPTPEIEEALRVLGMAREFRRVTRE